MPAGLPPRQPSTLPLARTLCHQCDGEGLVARWRASHFDGLAPAEAREIEPCRQCFGTEWLPGISPPC